MRSRNRNRRGRLRISPSTPAFQPPPQLSLTTEIEQSVEARDKLEAAAPGLNTQREQAKRVFLRSLAADLQAAVIAPNLVRDRLAAWKTDDARAAEQYDAAQQLVILFKDRVEGFKTASRTEASGAIQNIIKRLTDERGKPGADQNAINARIGKLSDELKPLQEVLPEAPSREPREGREEPPQRKSKTKTKTAKRPASKK